MDATSEKRLAEVNPVLAGRVRALATSLGFPILVTMGLRNSAEQEALWEQGRFALNIVNDKRAALNWPPLTPEENKIVTKAAPGHSWHEYGLAVDVVPLDPKPDWDVTHPQWGKIVETARLYSLLDGISFDDRPHLQPVEIPVSPTPEYENFLKTVGLQGAWDYARLQP